MPRSSHSGALTGIGFFYRNYLSLIVFLASQKMKICIRANGQKIPATLEDNLTAQHFYRLLPMTLNMDDFGGKEKISDPPEPLSKEGAPIGAVARAGDLMLFAPWGNLALFYRDHGFAQGLIPVARVESHLDRFASSEPVQVQFLKTEE